MHQRNEHLFITRMNVHFDRYTHRQRVKVLNASPSATQNATWV